MQAGPVQRFTRDQNADCNRKTAKCPQQSRRLRFPPSVPPASVSAVAIANHGQKVQKATVRQ